MVFSLTSLFVLQALDGAWSARPGPATDNVQFGFKEKLAVRVLATKLRAAADAQAELEEMRENSKMLAEEPVSSKASFVRHYFTAFAGATGLPVWGVRAAVWPVFMHPGVAVSVVALDMAASYANLTEVAVSYIELPASPASLAQQVPADVVDMFNLILTFSLVGSAVVVVNFGVMVIFALFHQRLVTNRRPQFPSTIQDEVSLAQEPHDFHYSCIRCWGPSTFLYAFVCPGVRHGDTMAATGIFSFWLTVGIFIVLELVFGAVFAWSEELNRFGRFMIDMDASLLRGLVLAVVFVPKRAALRRRLNSPLAGWWYKDIALWILCSWCVIAQEGLQVDAAEGLTVSCPCRLIDTKTGELVGTPVAEAKEEDS